MSSTTDTESRQLPPGWAWTTLGEIDADAGWDASTWLEAMAPYFEDYATVGIGPEARSPTLFQVVDERAAGHIDPIDPIDPVRRWRVRQVLDDPDGFHEWAIVIDVDLTASDDAGSAVVRPLAIERL